MKASYIVAISVAALVGTISAERPTIINHHDHVSTKYEKVHKQLHHHYNTPARKKVLAMLEDMKKEENRAHEI